MRSRWEPFFSQPASCTSATSPASHAAFIEAGVVRGTGPADAVWRAMASDLGLPDQVGKPVELRG